MTVDGVVVTSSGEGRRVGLAVGVAVNVLGPLVVVRADGSPIRVPSASQRRLLAALVVDAGTPVSTDRLAARMALSAGALRVVVCRLRRTLGEASWSSLVVTEPPGYALRPDRVDAVDAVRFDRLLRSAAGSASVDDRRRALADAVALWRGPPFAEFADARWARGAAARLTERHGAACEELARLLLDAGDAAGAVIVAADLTDAYPLRETGWALLVEGLVVSGRRAEALDAVRGCRAVLAERAGLAPGPALSALERAARSAPP